MRRTVFLLSAYAGLGQASDALWNAGWGFTQNSNTQDNMMPFKSYIAPHQTILPVTQMKEVVKEVAQKVYNQPGQEYIIGSSSSIFSWGSETSRRNFLPPVRRANRQRYWWNNRATTTTAATTTTQAPRTTYSYYTPREFQRVNKVVRQPVWSPIQVGYTPAPVVQKPRPYLMPKYYSIVNNYAKPYRMPFSQPEVSIPEPESRYIPQPERYVPQPERYIPQPEKPIYMPMPEQALPMPVRTIPRAEPYNPIVISEPEVVVAAAAAPVRSEALLILPEFDCSNLPSLEDAQTKLSAGATSAFIGVNLVKLLAIECGSMIVHYEVELAGDLAVDFNEEGTFGDFNKILAKDLVGYENEKLFAFFPGDLIQKLINVIQVTDDEGMGISADDLDEEVTTGIKALVKVLGQEKFNERVEQVSDSIEDQLERLFAELDEEEEVEPIEEIVEEVSEVIEAEPEVAEVVEEEIETEVEPESESADAVEEETEAEVEPESESAEAVEEETETETEPESVDVIDAEPESEVVEEQVEIETEPESADVIEEVTETEAEPESEIVEEQVETEVESESFEIVVEEVPAEVIETPVEELSEDDIVAEEEVIESPVEEEQEISPLEELIDTADVSDAFPDEEVEIAEEAEILDNSDVSAAFPDEVEDEVVAQLLEINNEEEQVPETFPDSEEPSLLDQIVAEATSEDEDAPTELIDNLTDQIVEIMAKELTEEAPQPIIDSIVEETGESEEVIKQELQAELAGETEEAPLIAAEVDTIIEQGIEEQDDDLLAGLLDVAGQDSLDIEQQVADAIRNDPVPVQDAADEFQL